ncbi:MAG: amidohydrolase [Flavobacteriales bacterium]|nr:amidohydrolase [Flavobacteriales bacterium]
MNPELRVTTVQCNLFWEQPEANRNHIEGLISDAGEVGEVIILPEMFTTGFTMNPETHAENLESGRCATIDWMRQMAKKHEAVVCGSVAICEEERFLNRLYWVEPSGQMLYYDKRHLFSLGKEHDHYKSGNKRVIAEWKGWKFSLNICYDLRFPVWARNAVIDGIPAFDVQVFVANWPEVRIVHWSRLLQARAIENQCYVAGVNRQGEDGNGVAHNGGSQVLDFNGESLMAHPDFKDSVLTTSLIADELHSFRARLPFLSDADRFTIH